MSLLYECVNTVIAGQYCSSVGSVVAKLSNVCVWYSDEHYSFESIDYFKACQHLNELEYAYKFTHLQKYKIFYSKAV